MIHCDIILSQLLIQEEMLAGKTAIVIDTLRATSVMVTALAKGALDIRCVLEPEEALALKQQDPRLILGGERQALKIPGFDHSNSPLEYTRAAVEGRRLIMTTSNGTRALLKSQAAAEILIGSALNARAVITAARERGRDIVLVNAGTAGQFSMDDFITAGAMLHRLEEESVLSDLAQTACLLYESHPDLHSALRHTLHYSRLRSLGLQADLDYCLSLDQLDLVAQCQECLVSLR